MMGQVYARRPDLRFLLFYGPEEKHMAEEVLGHCPVPEAVVIPENVVGLRQMAALQSWRGCMWVIARLRVILPWL